MIRHIGLLIVFGCVLGGFLIAGGKIPTLIQPAEFIVIAGAAAGSLIVSLTPTMLRKLLRRILGVFGRTPYTVHAAGELLRLLYQLTVVARREGVLALERHVREPHSSPLFSGYPVITGNPRLMRFIIEALMLQVDGAVDPDDLREILDTELDTHHGEESVPGNVLQKMGDALPGLGIVAAVLGIIITMGHMDGGPEVVGHHVAAALVGTFLGVLLAYGLVQPLVTAMEGNLRDEENFLEAVKSGMIAFAHGKAPVVVTEVARRTFFEYNRPDREATEEACKALRAA
ncbi:MAG: flagellar motor stator protein MotA [Candidatus Eisenbacteria bacterium]|uniref:Flagellar motor stator protein MotA n=1 Tax=Eiseniibacteriota bacterium TaxID=2212470 RepID=A0A938BQ45_UNCEI|nr:flagellar motor stator protein MotA [Candidatus Eisenbacteria bacterium]